MVPQEDLGFFSDTLDIFLLLFSLSEDLAAISVFSGDVFEADFNQLEGFICVVGAGYVGLVNSLRIRIRVLTLTNNFTMTFRSSGNGYRSWMMFVEREQGK